MGNSALVQSDGDYLYAVNGANTLITFQLCQGEGPVVLDHLQNQADTTEIPADLASIQPPLDYAPKSSPDEKGMLNEEFGLDRKATEAKTVQAPSAS